MCGLRLEYWLRKSPRWGILLDYANAKMLAELDETIAVHGTGAGETVSGEERLGDTFLRLGGCQRRPR